MEKLEILNLYDSHVHLLSTGQRASRLDLTKLSSARDVPLLKVNGDHFQGSWLVGFGWDENRWIDSSLPHRDFLDNLFPTTPVFFIRADGHSSWVNSLVLRALQVPLIGWDKFIGAGRPSWWNFVELDSNGIPTGVLRESAHMAVFSVLPRQSDVQIKSALGVANRIFNNAGFTHIRDMSTTEQQWNLLSEMESHQLLKLFVDANFTCNSLNDLGNAVAAAKYARAHSTDQLRSRGIKIYYDGSLGSETALLSMPYLSSSHKMGDVFWDSKDVGSLLKEVWREGLDVSVHVIGDQAADDIVRIARSISAEGHVGKLNLEHVEILRPETIQKMKSLHIRCHIQPCHWHTDKIWLRQKIGTLYPHAFPWEALRLAKVPLSFGSDSPIESPSFFNNLSAMNDSEESGIRKFLGNPVNHHVYPEFNQQAPGFQCKTIFIGEKVDRIIFRGVEIELTS